jgi:hypothetical protein
MVKDENEINFSPEKLKEMIAACVGPEKVPKQVSIHTDTSDFYRIDYDDVVVLGGRPYLVRNNEREGRFGIEEQQAWVEEQGVKAEKMVAEYRGILIRSGFAENAINAVAALQDRPSVAECILSRLTELKCSTVVVGRRGITRKEEFLFGSTSSKILREAKDCSIWVIQ